MGEQVPGQKATVQRAEVPVIVSMVSKAEPPQVCTPTSLRPRVLLLPIDSHGSCGKPISAQTWVPEGCPQEAELARADDLTHCSDLFERCF